MAVLHASPERKLNITVLNKALFYLDLYALRDLGTVVTGQDYVALPQGPVVQSYPNVLIKPLAEAGLAEQLDQGRAKPVRAIGSIGRYAHLTADEYALAGWIGASFHPLTSLAVSDYSHKNPGWMLAFRDYVEGRPGPKINMLIALQQIHDLDESDDEWMNAPADEALLVACSQAHLATRVWE